MRSWRGSTVNFVRDTHTTQHSTVGRPLLSCRLKETSPPPLPPFSPSPISHPSHGGDDGGGGHRGARPPPQAVPAASLPVRRRLDHGGRRRRRAVPAAEGRRAGLPLPPRRRRRRAPRHPHQAILLPLHPLRWALASFLPSSSLASPSRGVVWCGGDRWEIGARVRSIGFLRVSSEICRQQGSPLRSMRAVGWGMWGEGGGHFLGAFFFPSVPKGDWPLVLGIFC